MTTQIEIATNDAIANKKIVSHIGLVVGVGTVAFGPLTTSKAKGAYLKAMSELKSSAIEKGLTLLLVCPFHLMEVDFLFPCANYHPYWYSG